MHLVIISSQMCSYPICCNIPHRLSEVICIAQIRRKKSVPSKTILLTLVQEEKSPPQQSSTLTNALGSTKK